MPKADPWLCEGRTRAKRPKGVDNFYAGACLFIFRDVRRIFPVWKLRRNIFAYFYNFRFFHHKITTLCQVKSSPGFENYDPLIFLACLDSAMWAANKYRKKNSDIHITTFLSPDVASSYSLALSTRRDSLNRIATEEIFNLFPRLKLQ